MGLQSFERFSLWLHSPLSKISYFPVAFQIPPFHPNVENTYFPSSMNFMKYLQLVEKTDN